MNSKISKYIDDKKQNGEKVLSVFLTSGFPNTNDFTELALKTLDAAVSGGAEFIVLCETNGGTIPFELEEIVKK